MAILSIIMMVVCFLMYNRYQSFADFYSGVEGGGIVTPAIMTFVLGLLLLLASLFGFVGIFKESTCLVNTYAFVLATLLILDLVVVILSFTVDIISVKNSLNIPIQQYVTDSKIEREIDQLQTSLNCCGSEWYMDYEGMAFTAKHSTSVFPASNYEQQIVVPASCCITNGPLFCINRRTDGCQMPLINLYIDISSAIRALGIVSMVLMTGAIMSAVVLARRIRRAKTERGVRSWTIRERIIIARRNQTSPEPQPTHQDATATDDLAPPPYSAT
ncbi:tetraspanin-33-like [Bicyclus anynana]|uniref:Tetraspanin-33-like n=1 Tax=Bicyclus anynana TaxID=110368 RepID=A0A6J1NP92_BICAN|nr:tetraspanin-33-like [Bicyclus anynana]